MAYVDDDVPLGNGRYLIEPMVIARLVQIAQPVPGERALVVAAGPGYGAALLAACGAQVTALEDDEALLAAARDVLPTVAPRVAIISGPLTEGCPQGAPWDLILIEGAVHAIPPTIGSQVKREGGRLLTVLGSPGGVGQAVLAEPTVGGLRAAPQFDCGTPLLPAFAPAPSFVF
jgi:protein-L-isoaspartate(D-aspartate) O-methyltransferase